MGYKASVAGSDSGLANALHLLSTLQSVTVCGHMGAIRASGSPLNT